MMPRKSTPKFEPEPPYEGPFIAFHIEWLDAVISRFRPRTGNPEVDQMGRAILASASILAQSLNFIAEALDRMGEKGPAVPSPGGSPGQNGKGGAT
jgi:hypothetical protein